MKDKIAVLIPCYNESKTIEKVVTDFKRELPEAKIYVYDNNSTDGTDKIAKKAGAIVKYETKQGNIEIINYAYITQVDDFFYGLTISGPKSDQSTVMEIAKQSAYSIQK